MTTRLQWIDLLCFQSVWFVCALGAANGRPWLATCTASAILLVRLWLNGFRVSELQLLCIALASGLLFDSILVASGLLRFQSGSLASWATAPWMLVLWMAFAASFNASMKWIRDRTATAVVLGAFCGPLAYTAGERLGAIELSPGNGALAVLAVGWAVATPALARAAATLEGKCGMRTIVIGSDG